MNIYRETEIFHPLYVARLENGVIIEVYGDRARGNDGRTYYHVGREDRHGDLHTVGWTADTSRAVTLKSE